MKPLACTPQFFYRMTSFKWFLEEQELREFWRKQSIAATAILIEKFGKEAVEKACQELGTRYIPEIQDYLKKNDL